VEADHDGVLTRARAARNGRSGSWGKASSKLSLGFLKDQEFRNNLKKRTVSDTVNAAEN
jgi:hypothetical protein